MRRLREAVLVAAMMIVSGCGHQVTGLNQPSGAIVPSGQTLIRFETADQPDFNNFKYLIVLNVTGNGHVPYALGYNSNYTDWSFAFLAGGGPGFANAPVLFQYFSDPTQSQGVNKRILQYPTGSVTFSPLSATGAAAFGFDIRFDRCITDVPSPINTTGMATPAPSPHPAGSRCPPFFYLPATTWVMNVFTIDTTDTVVDSLGNGPSDTSYPGFILDTTATISGKSYIKPVTGTAPQNAHGAIYGIEVFSTP